MIKINLLPFRLAREKEDIQRQVTLFSLLIILVIVFLAWHTVNLERKISGTKKMTEELEAKALIYKKKADRVAQINRSLKILEEKLKIVALLEKQRKEHLLLLESLNEMIIPEKMWLENLKADQDNIMLQGLAFDNLTIADFMNNLEKSSVCGNISLNRSKVRKLGKGIMLKDFELLCTKEKPEPEGKKRNGP